MAHAVPAEVPAEGVTEGVDGVEAEQQSLKDHMEADRYLESKEAVKQGRGFRLSKLVPPGA